MDLIEHRFVGTHATVGNFQFHEIGEVYMIPESELESIIGVSGVPFLTVPLFEAQNFDPVDVQRFRSDVFYGELPDYWSTKVDGARKAFLNYHYSLKPGATKPLPLASE